MDMVQRIRTFDIELLDQTGKKKALNKNGDVLLDEKVPQPTSFLNYEAAINAVIIQNMILK